MECRTPLFQTTSQTSQGGGSTVPLGSERRGSNGGVNNTPISAFRSPSSPTPNTPVNRRYHPSPSYRYGYQHYSSTNSQNSPNGGSVNKVEPIPLPCPKNLVLMSIMEATQRRHLITSSSSCEDDQDAYKENEFEILDNDHHILDGIEEIASNSSGTYVIRERNGLELHPKYPLSENKFSQDGNSFMDHKVHKLQYGQKVQISEERDGVYVLARRQGYIVASNSQIVRGKNLKYDENINYLRASLITSEFYDSLKLVLHGTSLVKSKVLSVRSEIRNGIYFNKHLT